MQPFVGQIIPVGFNFAPVGWFLCQGQLVPIDQYTVLYTLIGTAYGGDGVQTFGIPDLRGRVSLHDGQGSGLSSYFIGQLTGAENVTLLSSQVGAHTHSFMTSTKAADSITPASTTALGLASAGVGISVYGPGPSNTTLAPNAIGNAGSSAPHENRQPYLAVNFIIAWAGIFPSQT
jgi:microcystin-dependent protein